MTVHILVHESPARGQVNSPAFLLMISQVKKERRNAFISRLARRLKGKV
jgi:hypothetical protein